ncbi:hypothetical protein Tco_0281553, partial [Tanacetum coccineum]
VLCAVLGYTHDVSAAKQKKDIYDVSYGNSHRYISIDNSEMIIASFLVPKIILRRWRQQRLYARHLWKEI